MNKKAVSIWTIFLIVLVILFVGWLISNNVYANYNSVKLDSKDYICNNNKIELKPNEISSYGVEFRPDALTKCLQECRGGQNWKNYYKEKEVVYCDANNEPICECKTSVYTYYITPLF